MSRPRVLVVDDDGETLELFDQHLAAEGYDLRCEQAPERALRRLREERFDLLICDIVMPEISGFEVIRACREHRPGAVCIAVTGCGTEQVLREVLAHGCFGYVNKPFDWAYLKLLIRKAIAAAGESTAERKPGSGRRTGRKSVL
jgi:DNA-binding NtrC family response regulator